MIELTQAAASEVLRLQAIRQTNNNHLRLVVKMGGCSGLYYDLEFPQEMEARDRHYEHQGISILVDEQSEPYLQGLKLDYSEDLMGGGFRFHNPNAQASCDCGHSFTPHSTKEDAS